MAIVSLVTVFGSALPAFADPLPDSEIQALHSYPEWVTASVASCSSISVPAGSLPSFVPEPYNGAFTLGAKNHNVAPALIAALFTEENFTGIDPQKIPGEWASFVKEHPDPNSGWPTSYVGASGPFQFMPATWTGLGYNLQDINNLVTAADAAGKYAQSDGATADKPESSWSSFIFSYNHADWYVKAVLGYYDYYNGAGSGPGGAASPLSTDMQSGCSSGTISPDCAAASATGNAKILCAAEAYNGIYYLYGGGPHYSGGFAAFQAQCPASVLSTAASSSTSSSPGPCATDCSGLVSVAVDTAFGQDLGWNVGTLEADTANWQKLPSIANVQPGDVVVVGSEHVEIVESYSSGKLKTFGSHQTGTKTGEVNSTQDYWTAAYRYIGPGSQQ